MSLFVTWAQAQENRTSQQELRSIFGKVKSVVIVPYVDNAENGGVHITLDTDEGDETVHLGMHWFKDNRNLTIKEGDRLMVVGIRFPIKGLNLVSPKSIKKMENDGVRMRLGN